MLERLRNIPARILEWWNKFDARRKLIIASSVVVVVVALVILGIIVSRPNMVTLITCETTKEASEVNTILQGDNIQTQVSDDGLVIKVKKGDLSAANLLLGSNGYATSDYSDQLDKVFSDGFSATESDKKKRYTAYLENQIVEDLTSMDVIESARVNLDVPVEDGTIISKEQDTFASVTLTLNDEIDDDVAASLARFVATAVGNKDTSCITILDSKANLLFSGEDSDGTGMSSAQVLSQKAKLENQMKKNVRSVVLDTKQYDSVTVAPNLIVSNSNSTIETEEFFAQAERDLPFYSTESSYTSESENGIEGTPGTDSNDDTTYDILDNGTSKSTVEEYERTYQPDTKKTTTLEGAGSINQDESSISVVASTYVYYNEEQMEEAGQLENQTFAEFMAANQDDVQVEVGDDLYELVHNATGIPRDRITILAYEIPFFQEKPASTLPYSTILTIVMLVLILGLLAFIVFKGTRSVVVEEVEPEVSVEELLASTRTEELDDIEYEEKSETRKMIEKFVDENPQAVAQLLRNWLNDDWG